MTRGPSRDREAPAGPGWLGVAVTAAGIALAALIVLAIPDLRHAVSSAVHGDTDAVRSQVDDLGATGALVVLALSLIHIVVWYPAEILNTAAGYAYGFPLGLPLMMGCWMVSGYGAYAVGRGAARPLLFRLAGRKRVEHWERLVEQGGISLLITIRLVPIVPFSLMCYACGAARVPLGRFTWTTLVGYLPITAIFVYLGSRLDTLSATDPRLLASAVVLIALLAATRWLGPKLSSADTSG